MSQLVSHLIALYANVGLDLKQLDMDPLPCLCCQCLRFEREQFFMLAFFCAGWGISYACQSCTCWTDGLCTGEDQSLHGQLRMPCLCQQVQPFQSLNCIGNANVIVYGIPLKLNAGPTSGNKSGDSSATPVVVWLP